MGLTNTLGLLGLIAVPIIIILYMLRPKNKPVTIPSLYLWKQMQEEIEKAVRIKKLKSSILMFLQIFVVLLMVLILSGLFIVGRKDTTDTLMIIDAGYTMAAVEDGEARIDRAITQGKQYLNKLDSDSLVTLMVVEDVPKTLAKDESNFGLVSSLIEDIEAVDGVCSMDLLEQSIEAVREPGQEVLYIGDRYLAGVSNIRTISSDENFSVHDITYTKYFQEGTITALTEIFNHDNKEQTIQVSLYVDDQYFGTKQVDIIGEASGKLFFDGIPYDAGRLHVEIDNEDILEKDNHAYAIIQTERTQKVLLISEGNTFLEKALNLHPNVEVYVSDVSEGLYGYDLYVYDGISPVEYPASGSYMLFSPDNVPDVELLGYAENPVITTANHSIINHIENPEFATRVSGIFDVSNDDDIIYNTTYGAAAFETLIQDNRTLVFGFDIQDTNMPLSIEFPILMMNSLDFLLSNRMVENRSYYVGENLEISVLPSGVDGFVETPGKVVYPLSFDRRQQVLPILLEAGIYTVQQQNSFDIWTEQFAVNYPVQFIQEGNINDDDLLAANQTNKYLMVYLGMGIFALLLAEWLIYGYRRRIHEY